MFRKFLASAAFALAVVMPAAAEETPAAPEAQKAPIAKPDEMVCKKEEVVGTRFPRRVCMTRAQWEQRSLNARRNLGDQQRGGGNPPNMGGG